MRTEEEIKAMLEAKRKQSDSTNRPIAVRQMDSLCCIWLEWVLNEQKEGAE